MVAVECTGVMDGDLGTTTTTTTLCTQKLATNLADASYA